MNVLRAKGIQSEKVLHAMSSIPRHLFMDSALESHAYEDKAFPIAADQTISQPYTVAFQTELLNVSKGDKILEIGTGSGYQTAVLVSLGAEVYTVERQQKLFKITEKFIPKLGYRPKHMSFGDGYKGIPKFAPFDSIIVTAGAPFVPTSLLSQLKIGGKLIIPVGEKKLIMTVITRVAKTEFLTKEYGEFRFVPLLKDKN